MGKYKDLAIVIVLIIAIGWSFLYIFVGNSDKGPLPENAAAWFLKYNGVKVDPDQAVLVYRHVSDNGSDWPTLSIIVANRTYNGTDEPDKYTDATWYKVDPVPAMIQVVYLPDWWGWDDNGRMGVVRKEEIPIRLETLQFLSVIKYPEFGNMSIPDWVDENIDRTNFSTSRKQIKIDSSLWNGTRKIVYVSPW